MPQHSPEFKAKIAADHAVHPIQVNQRKKQLLEGTSEIFTRGKKTQAKNRSLAATASSRWNWSDSEKSELLGRL